MLILGIILIAIAAIGVFIYMITSEDDYSPISMFLMTFMYLGTALTTKHVQEKDTAIECLKGNSPYKMEIRYELQDSIYVPIDTIYIKL